jgi:hypothetical protein
MTVKNYLHDVFVYDSTQNNLDFYKVAVQGKGEIIAEYDSTDETVSLIHTDRSGRQFNYFVKSLEELRETVDYCIGPIVTDSQWKHATSGNEFYLDDGDDWDLVD